MKLWKKITIGITATIITILAGTLTVIDRSLSIYNQIKARPSEVPENYVEKEPIKAAGIENNNVKQIAEGTIK